MQVRDNFYNIFVTLVHLNACHHPNWHVTFRQLYTLEDYEAYRT